MLLSVLKVFAPTALAFFIGIMTAPILTNYLYKHKLWKKKAGKTTPDGKTAEIFNELHKEKEVGTPRMGGIIIWSSTILTTLIFWLWWKIDQTDISEKMNFLSRNQTWLPIFTLFVGSLVGLVDDILQVRGEAGAKSGLSFSKRAIMVIIMGLAGAWWFYSKLDVTTIHIPFAGELYLGLLIIPFFVAVMLALFSSGVVDGLDGLSGGIMATIFSAYAGIAFFQNQIDLAALSATIAGAILAFLWFNIPPARFYMSETGILGLTTTLTVIAFFTQTVLLLPIIAFPLAATSASVIIQLGSKKFRNGKKVFKVAPLHHHFEAIGWPAYKVVMRYWVIGIICAVIGMILAIIS